MRRAAYSLLLIAVLGGTPWLAGCQLGTLDPGKAVNDVIATMEQGVEALDKQSSSWQVTLGNLTNQLTSQASTMERQVTLDVQQTLKQVAQDAHDLANQVSYLAKDGEQFASADLKCTADIIANHARIEVNNALVGFVNKWKPGDKQLSLLPYLPTVCTFNPGAVNVDGWQREQKLTLAGTDFNLFRTKPPLVYIVNATGLRDLVDPVYVNVETNYQISINVTPLIERGSLKADSVKMVVEWGGRSINSNDIVVVPPGKKLVTDCSTYGQASDPFCPADRELNRGTTRCDKKCQDGYTRVDDHTCRRGGERTVCDATKDAKDKTICPNDHPEFFAAGGKCYTSTCKDKGGSTTAACTCQFGWGPWTDCAQFGDYVDRVAPHCPGDTVQWRDQKCYPPCNQGESKTGPCTCDSSDVKSVDSDPKGIGDPAGPTCPPGSDMLNGVCYKQQCPSGFIRTDRCSCKKAASP